MKILFHYYNYKIYKKMRLGYERKILEENDKHQKISIYLKKYLNFYKDYLNPKERQMLIERKNQKKKKDDCQSPNL